MESNGEHSNCQMFWLLLLLEQLERRLLLPHAAVKTTQMQQFLVRALLHNLAIFHHDDEV